MKKMSHRTLLIAILLLAVFTRFFRLGTPNDYVFDEVYHAFTAQEYVAGNIAAWQWWSSPPQDFAYEWTHPPMAKHVMSVGIAAFSWLPGTLERVPDPGGEDPLGASAAQTGQNPFGWRFSVAVLSVGVVVLLYLLGRALFGPTVGLLAALFATIDGMFLVLGRIGMSETIFLFFQLAAVLFFVQWTRKTGGRWYLVLTGVFLGLALATKWSAVYGIGLLGLWWGVGEVERIRGIGGIRGIGEVGEVAVAALWGAVVFVVIPLGIYLASYAPFLLSGHSLGQLWELQNQMWWYHTGLTGSHDYQSPAWTWPLMLRPVWLFVKRTPDSIANIYILGNPVLWWGGLAAAVYSIKYIVSRIKYLVGIVGITKFRRLSPNPNAPSGRSQNNLLFVLAAYVAFFVPWVLSPRIMFLYHYFPSLAFLFIILAWALVRFAQKSSQHRVFIGFSLLFAVVLSVFFYPHWTAFALPQQLVQLYFWFPSWQ